MVYGIVKAMRGENPRIVARTSIKELAPILMQTSIKKYKSKTGDYFLDDVDFTIQTFYNGK